jgi:hypothetical protein
MSEKKKVAINHIINQNEANFNQEDRDEGIGTEICLERPTTPI